MRGDGADAPRELPLVLSFFSRTASKTEGGSRSRSYSLAPCTVRSAVVALSELAVCGLYLSEKRSMSARAGTVRSSQCKCLCG